MVTFLSVVTLTIQLSTFMGSCLEVIGREGGNSGKGRGKKRERQRTKGRKGGENVCLRNCAHRLTKILIKY